MRRAYLVSERHPSFLKNGFVGMLPFAIGVIVMAGAASILGCFPIMFLIGNVDHALA